MDLNMSSIFFSGYDERAMNDTAGDTSLHLNSIGYFKSKTVAAGTSQSNDEVPASKVHDDGCGLVLGLGPTPSSYSDSYHSTGVNKKEPAAPRFGQRVTSEDESGLLRLGLSRETENVAVLDNSVSGQSSLTGSYLGQISNDGNRLYVPVVDEGSSSAKKSGGYMPSLIHAPRLAVRKSLLSPQHSQEIPSKGHHRHHHHHHHPILSPEPSATTHYSMEMFSEPVSTREPSDQRSHLPRKCKFNGCSKGARGASGLCIAHGGGQRCQKPGCNKGAESRTAYCKAHGGGRRCQQLGCTKSAEGKTDYCIAHGGGRRCGHPGCSKAARGRSGLCIRHGGGKRCKVEGCTRSAEGQAGLCISHGGGRRCQYPECTKGAQGSTAYCKAHGGGKRCIFAGCTKGAEGSTPLCKGHGGGKRCLYDGGGICPKSVHGGTDYCVAHGGGKRCAVPGCTKSARGRTDYCVRHGGGKRCRVENCGKSAQGSTDFCKAHGGGKRCTWGQGSCEKFARGKSGLCAAHGSMVQDKDYNKGSIGPGLFSGPVTVPAFGSSYDNDYSSSGVSAVSDCMDSAEKPAKRQQLIPSQVLVPSSMKASQPLIPSQVLVPLSMKASASLGVLSAGRGEESGMVQNKDYNKGSIGPGLFGGLVTGPAFVSSYDNDYSSLGVGAISDCMDSAEKPAKRQQLIPSQVLVPLSMKASASLGALSAGRGEERSMRGGSGSKSFSYDIPEGRVHGGGLLSLLGGNMKNAIDGI